MKNNIETKKEMLIKGVVWREKHLKDRKLYLHNIMQDSQYDDACKLLASEINLIRNDLCNIGE